MGGRTERGRQISLHVLCCFPDVVSGKPAKSRGALGWPPWVTMQGRQRRMVRVSAQSEACPEHKLPGDRCSIEDLRLLGLTL